MSYVVAMRWCNAVLLALGLLIAALATGVGRVIAAGCAGYWLWRLWREWHDPNV